MGTTAYEAAYHVEQARLRGGLPATDSRFTTTRMLNLLTDELQGSVAPLVHNSKADHGIVPYMVTATAGTARYALPPGAFASTLRDVYWITSSDVVLPLSQRSAADPEVLALRAKQAPPRLYTLQGSTVVLCPVPDAAGTLALPYYNRPGRLVLVGSCLTIAAVVDEPTATSVRVRVFYNGTSPFAFTTARLDVVSATPGFDTLRASALNSNPDEVDPGVEYIFTFDTTEMSRPIAAGDYICLPGESPVPQVPVELFALLHARAALVAVPSTGDTSQAAQGLSAQAADLDARAREFLRPRVESASPQVGRGMGSNPLLGGLAGSWR